ncbi:MAG: hypothetical protein ABL964_00640 [Steroidobacteraceae bacterium]
MNSTHASSYTSKIDGWLAVIMVSPKDSQGFLAELKARREASA